MSNQLHSLSTMTDLTDNLTEFQRKKIAEWDAFAKDNDESVIREVIPYALIAIILLVLAVLLP